MGDATETSAASARAAESRPRPVALVTGASAGLGAHFARRLAARGYDLVLVARREERLLELKREVAERHGARAMAIPMDLAVPTAPREIHRIATSSGLEVSYLVNNAGYGVRGRFLSVGWSTHADFLQVMVGSWLHLTHLFVPAMVARGHGRVLNVSSLASLGPEPPGSLYSPAKCLMTSASRALRFDLLGTGVHCTALCPGFTYTEFHDVLGCRAEMNRLPRFMWQDAAPVVEAGLAGVERNRPVVVPGLFNRFAALACRALPYALTHRLIPRAVLEEHGDRDASRRAAGASTATPAAAATTDPAVAAATGTAPSSTDAARRGRVTGVAASPSTSEERAPRARG